MYLTRSTLKAFFINGLNMAQCKNQKKTHLGMHNSSVRVCDITQQPLAKASYPSSGGRA